MVARLAPVQTYTCLACNTPWSRSTARGQRPRYCPECRAKQHSGKRCLACNSLGVRRDADYCSLTCSVWKVMTGKATPIPDLHPVRSTRIPPTHPAYSRCESRDFRISASVRAAIYERDGWRCHLCEGDVEPWSGTWSPTAASLDHVVPRSHGGTDEPENLRTAHVMCNSARGAMPVGLWQGRSPVELLAS